MYKTNLYSLCYFSIHIFYRMLRIILNTALSFILLTTTSGYTVTRHYCRGDLVSVSLNSKTEPFCNMEGCCHSESEHFQLKENFVPAVEQCHFDHESVIDLNISDHKVIDTVLPQGSLLCKNSNINKSPPPGEIHSILSRLQTYLL